MYVLPVIGANSSLAHDSIYIDKTGGKIILYDMPANTVQSILHTVIFCLIFCSKISDKYQISIKDINQVIDITITLQ